MNQYVCSDVFSYYRWIDPESYYFRLMIKELIFNDYLKDIGKVLIRNDIPPKYPPSLSDLPEYIDEISQEVEEIVGFSYFYNFSNSHTVWKLLNQCRIEKCSYISDHIYDKGVICCILAETIEGIFIITDEYGMEDTREYQYCLQKYGPNFEENITEILKLYLGEKNGHWWSIVKKFFPNFDI